MKSRINDQNPPSPIALPLSFQERGKGEFAETNPPNLSQVLGGGASRNQSKSKIEKQNK